MLTNIAPPESLKSLRSRFTSAAMRYPGVRCTLTRESLVTKEAPIAKLIFRRKGEAQIYSAIGDLGSGHEPSDSPWGASAAPLSDGWYSWWFSGPENRRCVGVFRDLAGEAGEQLARYPLDLPRISPGDSSRRDEKAFQAVWCCGLFLIGLREGEPMAPRPRLRVRPHGPGEGIFAAQLVTRMVDGKTVQELKDCGESRGWAFEHIPPGERDLRIGCAYDLSHNPFSASAKLIDVLVSHQHPREGKDDAPPVVDYTLPVLIIDRDTLRVKYGPHHNLKVTPKGVVMLQAVDDANGEWVSDWGKYGISKPSAVKLSLPRLLRDLIETKPGAGYRFKRKPLEN